MTAYFTQAFNLSQFYVYLLQLHELPQGYDSELQLCSCNYFQLKKKKKRKKTFAAYTIELNTLNVQFLLGFCEIFTPAIRFCQRFRWKMSWGLRNHCHYDHPRHPCHFHHGNWMQALFYFIFTVTLGSLLSPFHR